MKVFSTCIKIIRAYGAMLTAFFVFFTILGVTIGSAMAQTTNTEFTSVRPSIGIVNRDGESHTINGLREYLSAYCDLRDLPDELEYLQDSTFANDPEYILIIPSGFTQKLTDGEAPELQKGSHQVSAPNYYADMLINQYVSVHLSYSKAGFEPGKATAAALNELQKSAEVQIKNFAGTEGIPEDYAQYLVWICYTLLLLIPLGVNAVTSAFKRYDLNQRNLCSPMPPRRQSMEIMLAGLLLGIVVFIMVTVAGLLAFGKGLAGTDTRQIVLLLANCFIFMLVALGLASVISAATNQFMVANVSSNMTAMIFSFLSGCFVPIEMFGDDMKKAAMFIPNYWSIQTIEAITDLNAFAFTSLRPVLGGMAMQLGFALFFFCLSLALGKVFEHRQPPTQTELDFA